MIFNIKSHAQHAFQKVENKFQFNSTNQLKLNEKSSFNFDDENIEDLTFHYEFDSTKREDYIENMNQFLVIQLNYINDNERFSVNTESTSFEIYPNGTSRVKLHINYRFLSFGINYIPKFITSNDDDLLKGKTKGFGLNTSFNFTNWIQSLSYSNTRGYYLENTSDYQMDWQEGDPYVQFPKLLYRNFQGTTGYSFNPNFSTKALLTGTERQIKSAGSFIPMLLYRYYLVDNRDEITANITTQKTNNFEILASAGYYYTYVPKEKFYISGGGSLGYGYLHTKLTTRSIDDEFVVNQNNGIFRYDLRASAGYNAERFYTGFTFTSENSRHRQSQTTVINSNWRVFTQFMVGYRFNAPQKLRDNLNKIWPQ